MRVCRLLGELEVRVFSLHGALLFVVRPASTHSAAHRSCPERGSQRVAHRAQRVGLRAQRGQQTERRIRWTQERRRYMLHEFRASAGLPLFTQMTLDVCVGVVRRLLESLRRQPNFQRVIHESLG